MSTGKPATLEAATLQGLDQSEAAVEIPAPAVTAKAACTPSRKAILTAGLSFAAGWADVVSYKTFKSFAALMTGNTVKLGLSITEPGQDAAESAYYVCIMLSYIFGVWLFQLCKRLHPGNELSTPPTALSQIADRLRTATGTAGRPGYVAAPICMALILVCDIMGVYVSDSKWRICLISPCFGIQNSLTFGGPMAVNTSIITGNMAKIGIALWKAMAEGKGKAQLKAVIKPLTAWFSTFVGAAIGAAVLLKLAEGNEHMFLPVGVIQVTCFVTEGYIFGKPRKPNDKDSVGSNV
jgi:uncharacterized membrane protein YoaK (UPF0700 family)